MPGTDSEIEIRQVFEEADFGELVAKVPEVFEAERRFREGLEAKGKAGKPKAAKR